MTRAKENWACSGLGATGESPRISARDRVVVTGLVDVARRLGIGVIAEGIENEADASFLSSYGCNEGQRHWFGEPVPAAIFEELHLGERLVSAV